MADNNIKRATNKLKHNEFLTFLLLACFALGLGYTACNLI